MLIQNKSTQVKGGSTTVHKFEGMNRDKNGAITFTLEEKCRMADVSYDPSVVAYAKKEGIQYRDAWYQHILNAQKQ